MNLGLWLALGACGAVGALARFVIDGTVGDRTGGTLPHGTLLVNLTGSLVLGLLTGLALYHSFPATPKLLIGSGFCGAYTTFSTFAFETVALARDGEQRAALLNVGVSLLAGVAAAGIGLALAALI